MKNPVTTAATTITGFESRERSRGGSGIGFSISADFASAAPYTEWSTAQSRNNPISAGTQVPKEVAILNPGERPDQHVLRVAGDRRDAADV